jgi:hypothetical protein
MADIIRLVKTEKEKISHPKRRMGKNRRGNTRTKATLAKSFTKLKKARIIAYLAICRVVRRGLNLIFLPILTTVLVSQYDDCVFSLESGDNLHRTVDNTEFLPGGKEFLLERGRFQIRTRANCFL